MDYFEYRDAIYASKLTAHQKLVALAISYHYNWKEKSPAFPSNSTLSRETSLSISTIVRAKRVLAETGWLVIQRRWDGPCDYTPCAVGATNNEYNNEVNNDYNNEYINTKNKKIPKEDIQIQEYHQSDTPSLASFKAQAADAAPWSNWR
jgi:hypothetical protein